MEQRTNEFGQPIGPDVPGWVAATPPNRDPIEGSTVRLVQIDADAHAKDLFAAYALDTTGVGWTYLPLDKPSSLEDMQNWMRGSSKSADTYFFAVLDRKTEKAIGFASYLRMDPKAGVIEVGFITMSPLLQQTPMSTETMFLMMARAFDDWGYRRYEWKCDALNAPSCRAAARLGFSFEGIFRQATMYKGRNRDTAWYSVLDSEWPRVKAAFQAWLSPDNFDATGRQIIRMEDIRETLD